MNQTPTEKLFPVAPVVATRRAPRRKVSGVTCEVVSHYWDEAVEHAVHDLSPFGAFVDTPFPLHPGAELVLCFSPPAGDPLTVFAEVKRAVTGRRKSDRGRLGMAVEFTDITYDEMVMVHRSLRNAPLLSA
ncbi:MAG: PilZ domain-containing protein [Polyangiaceae bacterium]